MEGIGKITFSPKGILFGVSRAYIFLKSRFLDGLLSFCIFLGFLSLVIIASRAIISFENGWLVLFPKIFFFIGYFSLIFRIFIRRYLRSYENKTPLSSEDENVDISNILSFEALRTLRKFNNELPNTQLLYKNIIGTSLVRFVLSEIDTNDGFIVDVASKLPQSLQEVHQSDMIFYEAYKIAVENESKVVTSADIFWGFLKNSKIFDQIMIDAQLEESDIKNLIYWADTLYNRELSEKNLTQKFKTYSPGIAESWAAGYTLALDRFSSDLTPRNMGSFSIGEKNDVIREIEDALTADAKNNCILTGALGTGKTTIVKEFARKIYWGESLPELNHMRVVKIDPGAIMANAKDHSELELIVRSVFNDAISAGNVILFIDDIHTLLAGGSKEGTADVSEIIIPYMEDSSLKIIGVTTESYYETYISSKPGVSGSLQKIKVEPSGKQETIKIMEDLSLSLGYKDHLKITYNAIKAIYQFAEGLSQEKDFPAKGIDLLEEVCASARNKKIAKLDERTADDILSQITKLPVAEAGKDEKSLLINLEEKIKSRVIGQKEAVSAVVSALKRKRTAAATDTTKPIGSFLFLGPTGVGKTELAKSLSWAYFNSESAMIRMDMSEFQDTESLGRFIGRKIPSQEELEGGDFVKKIRENPFSVVLLDELEKANPKILDLFLQILDEGIFTDGLGNRVIMKNTIIIATSNGGANIIRKGIEVGKDKKSLKAEVMEFIQSEGIYRPEFLNRFDEVILFDPLTKENIVSIANLMLAESKKEYKAKGYDIDFEGSLVETLANEGYDPEYGARPMKRAIQNKLENYIADAILKDTIKKGQNVIITKEMIYPESQNNG